MTNPHPRRGAGPRPRKQRRASGRMVAWTAAGAAGLMVIGGIAGTASGAFSDGGSKNAPAASDTPASPADSPLLVPDAAVPSPSETPGKTPGKTAKPRPSAKATPSRKPAPRTTTQRPSRPAPARTKKQAPAAPSGTGGSVAAQVISLVNKERAKQGCGAVTSNAKLARAAQAHSADMKARGFFDHTNPDGKDPGDRITAAGYRWSTYGENIAKGQPTPASVMQAWMNSPGHRANILNCRFKEIGVGVVSSGGPYWTQKFGTAR